MKHFTEMIRREVQRLLVAHRPAFRAVLSSLRKDTPQQLVDGTGLSDEQLRQLELFQHFGFSSAPPKDSQLIVVPLGGRTSAAVVVASEHGTYRFQLGADGEAALYNQWGDVVHLRADRTIHLQAQAKVLIDTSDVEVNASGSMVVNASSITLNAPLVTATGSIQAADDISDQGGEKSMRDMRQVYNGHHHLEHDMPPTSAPQEQM